MGTPSSAQLRAAVRAMLDARDALTDDERARLADDLADLDRVLLSIAEKMAAAAPAR